MKNKYAMRLYLPGPNRYHCGPENYKMLGVDMKPVDQHSLRSTIRDERIKERNAGKLTVTSDEDWTKSGVSTQPNCCVRCKTPYSAEGYYELGPLKTRLGICKLHKSKGGGKITWYPAATTSQS